VAVVVAVILKVPDLVLAKSRTAVPSAVVFTTLLLTVVESVGSGVVKVNGEIACECELLFVVVDA
ncbi:MAG: hypothetical protein RL200_405, partial [Actinomycetota bacterium]